MKTTLKVIIITMFVGFYSYGQTERNGSINSVINSITPEKTMKTIRKLESFGTRFMLAENRFDIANWIKNEFIFMGINDVELRKFQALTTIDLPYTRLEIDTNTTQVNVIATIPGTQRPDEIYIICGHYDSFSESSNQFLTAPGADDNASGTAAVIESARAIMDSEFRPEVTLKFICFAAEELMNFGDAGSEIYSEEAADRGDDIKLVVNNDMIGNSTLNGFSNRTIGIGYTNNFQWSEEMFSIAREYSDNEVERQSYTGADLRGFLSHGYQGLYFEETNFNPYYHSPNDIADNIDSVFVTESIKASCAVFLGLRPYMTDKDTEELPSAFSLKQNYPNPFNPGTIIEYSLDKAAYVSLKVYNVLGEQVADLVGEQQPLGSYKVRFDGKNFAGGVYFYTLQTSDYKKSRKMILLK